MFLFTFYKLSALRLFSVVLVILLFTSTGCEMGGAIYTDKEAVIGTTLLGYKTRFAELTYVDEEDAMVPLTVALQDGFLDDLVVVRVNDREVFSKEGVKTKFQIGLAHSFEVSVPAGLVHVEIILPQKNLSASIAVQVSNPSYLGVSVTPEGTIGYRVSQDPFGYL